MSERAGDGAPQDHPRHASARTGQDRPRDTAEAGFLTVDSEQPDSPEVSVVDWLGQTAHQAARRVGHSQLPVVERPKIRPDQVEAMVPGGGPEPALAKVKEAIAHAHDLLTRAAHDLRSDWANVRILALMLLESLEAGGDGLTSEERRELLGNMVTIATGASRVLDVVTTVGQLDQAAAEGSPRYLPQRINPLELCDRVVEESQALLQVHNRRLVVVNSLSADEAIMANPQLLRLVIGQFVDNAAPQGDPGVPIELSLQTVKHDDQDYVRIAVRDYGPALPNDAWHKLVHNLRQTRPIPTRPGSSSLSLAGAKRLADHLGARLGVTRHHDGVTIRIDCPCFVGDVAGDPGVRSIQAAHAAALKGPSTRSPARRSRSNARPASTRPPARPASVHHPAQPSQTRGVRS